MKDTTIKIQTTKQIKEMANNQAIANGFKQIKNGQITSNLTSYFEFLVLEKEKESK